MEMMHARMERVRANLLSGTTHSDSLLNISMRGIGKPPSKADQEGQGAVRGGIGRKAEKEKVEAWVSTLRHFFRDTLLQRYQPQMDAAIDALPENLGPAHYNKRLWILNRDIERRVDLEVERRAAEVWTHRKVLELAASFERWMEEGGDEGDMPMDVSEESALAELAHVLRVEQEMEREDREKKGVGPQHHPLLSQSDIERKMRIDDMVSNIRALKPRLVGGRRRSSIASVENPRNLMPPPGHGISPPPLPGGRRSGNPPSLKRPSGMRPLTISTPRQPPGLPSDTFSVHRPSGIGGVSGAQTSRASAGIMNAASPSLLLPLSARQARLCSSGVSSSSLHGGGDEGPLAVRPSNSLSSASDRFNRLRKKSEHRVRLETGVETVARHNVLAVSLRNRQEARRYWRARPMVDLGEDTEDDSPSRDKDAVRLIGRQRLPADGEDWRWLEDPEAGGEGGVPPRDPAGSPAHRLLPTDSPPPREVVAAYAGDTARSGFFAQYTRRGALQSRLSDRPTLLHGGRGTGVATRRTPGAPPLSVRPVPEFPVGFGLHVSTQRVRKVTSDMRRTAGRAAGSSTPGGYYASNSLAAATGLPHTPVRHRTPRGGVATGLAGELRDVAEVMDPELARFLRRRHHDTAPSRIISSLGGGGTAALPYTPRHPERTWRGTGELEPARPPSSAPRTASEAVRRVMMRPGQVDLDAPQRGAAILGTAGLSATPSVKSRPFAKQPQSATDAYLQSVESMSILPLPTHIVGEGGELVRPGQGLGGGYARAFIAALRAHPHLREINLRDNRMNPPDIVDAARALLGNPLMGVQLKVVDLSYNHVGRLGAFAMGELLHEARALRLLRLSGTRIDDTGAAAILSAALRRGVGVQELDLSRNSITAASAEAVAELVIGTDTIRRLDLGWNNLGSSVAGILGESLANGSPALEELDLRWNGVDDRGAHTLAVSLAHNYSLRTLDLSNNRLGSRGVLLMHHALRQSRTLQAVELVNNHTAASQNRDYYALANEWRDALPPEPAPKKRRGAGGDGGEGEDAGDGGERPTTPPPVPPAKFMHDNPTGAYRLDMRELYDQAVLGELIDLHRRGYGVLQELEHAGKPQRDVAEWVDISWGLEQGGQLPGAPPPRDPLRLAPSRGSGLGLPVARATMPDGGELDEELEGDGTPGRLFRVSAPAAASPKQPRASGAPAGEPAVATAAAEEEAEGAEEEEEISPPGGSSPAQSPRAPPEPAVVPDGEEEGEEERCGSNGRGSSTSAGSGRPEGSSSSSGRGGSAFGRAAAPDVDADKEDPRLLEVDIVWRESARRSVRERPSIGSVIDHPRLNLPSKGIVTCRFEYEPPSTLSLLLDYV